MVTPFKKGGKRKSLPLTPSKQAPPRKKRPSEGNGTEAYSSFKAGYYDASDRDDTDTDEEGSSKRQGGPKVSEKQLRHSGIQNIVTLGKFGKRVNQAYAVLENAFPLEDDIDVLNRLGEAIQSLPEDSVPAKSRKRMFGRAYNDLVKSDDHQFIRSFCRFVRLISFTLPTDLKIRSVTQLEGSDQTLREFVHLLLRTTSI